MLEKILIQNGLNEKEAKVYLSALELGEAPLATVAKKAKLQRTTVYSLVEPLCARGVLSLSKRHGVQYISALPPRILVERFVESASLAKEALPSFLEMAFSSPLKPRMRFLDGLEGVKEVLREMAASPVSAIGFTDYSQMDMGIFRFIRREIVPTRRKIGNFIRLIAPDNARNRQVQSEDEIHFGEHRLLKGDAPVKHVEILLYGRSMTGFLSSRPDEQFAVALDSPAIHTTLRYLFETLWGQAEAAPRLH